MVTAGELDQWITLRRKIETQNEYGALITTDLDYAKVRAKVRPMSGRERDRSQQTEARANYVVTIRTRTDVHEKDYIVWQGVEMNIRFLPFHPRSVFMSIEVERGAP